jgi:phage terminase large subunit-like protein
MRISPPLPRRRPSTDRDPVSAYAWDICKGRIVAGRLVRLACERHFRDIAEGPARGLVWRPDIAVHAIGFNRFLRHSKGEWAGRRLDLAPWQDFVHGSAFGWFRADGLRRYRVIYSEVARKNGKSTDAAAVALKGLIADGEPGADVFSAATKKDQARIVFDEARRMVMRSPELRTKVRVFRRSLAVDSTLSSFQPLSSDDRTMDGLNPHFVVVDELHKHKTRAVLDVLDTALGSRRQPLLWIIITAGDDNPETVYAQERAYAEQVLEGTFVDDAWFCYIATLDPDDQWDDPSIWIKANPNLGISVKVDDLERQARAARGSPQRLLEFKRLRLNMRQSSAEQKIMAELWDSNTRGPFDPASMHGRKCYAGLDLASKIDIAAFVKLFPPLVDAELWRVVCRFWIPGERVLEKSARDPVQYQRWIDDGWIEPTPGNVIDHSEVQAAVLEDGRLHDIISVAYDPWNATQLAVALGEHGVRMEEFVQELRSYNSPTKELDAMLAGRTLDHGDNPVLKWMALNMRVMRDKNENEMPTKKHSIGRIDGMSALIMAIGRSMLDAPSVYEDRGLDTF